MNPAEREAAELQATVDAWDRRRQDPAFMAWLSEQARRLDKRIAGRAAGTYPSVTNTAVQPVTRLPAPTVPTTPTVTTDGPTGASDGTPVANSDTPDPELADLAAAVDQFETRHRELAARLDRLEATVRAALEGDGR